MLARLYAAAAWCAMPLLRLMLRRRVQTGHEIAGRLPERRGVDASPRPQGELIWLHAASVGETVSILPLLVELCRRRPLLHVLMTTGTVTSAAMLARRLPELGLDRVFHRFVPLDATPWIARFLDHWRPQRAVFVESEIWPNTLAQCARRRIPIVLVNGRLSRGSHARWRRAPGFARRQFSAFSRVHAQSASDAERVAALGGPPAASIGNLKFAADRLPADPAELARLMPLLAGRPAWLAASTHAGEEEILLDVHRRLAARHSGLLTVIAPRHPLRGAAIAARQRAGRRSAGEDPPAAGGVWVADTLGELGLLFRLLPIVFVGRSLGESGGHNPLEPARLGCAVAVGPNTGNFTEIMDGLAEAGALARVADGPALADWITAMLAHPDRRAAMGARAEAAATRFAGLPGEVAALVLDDPP